MKKLVFLILSIMILTGCKQEPEQVNVSLYMDAFQYQMNVDDLSDFTLEVNTDSVIEYVVLNESMLDHPEYLAERGIHDIEITYKGESISVEVTVYAVELDLSILPIYQSMVDEEFTSMTYEEWLQTIQGEDGVGIDDVYLNQYGHLIIELTDGSMRDLGQITTSIEILDGYYLVNFYSVEGFIISSQLVEEGMNAVNVSYNPPPGYVFENWDTDFTNVTMSINVHPVVSMDQYTLVLYPNNGQNEVSEILMYGDEYELPIPEKEGYEFVGWFTEDNTHSSQIFSGDYVQDDESLYAQYQAIDYKLSFIDYNGYEIPLGEFHVGEDTILPALDLDDSIVVIEWYMDPTFEIVFDQTMPAHDVTLYTRYYEFEYIIEPDPIYGSHAIITDYFSFYNHLIIPDTIKGATVTRIGEEAFYQSTFSSVVLPPHLEVIGRYAFRDNENLKEITVPESVTHIYDGAFFGLDSLETAVLPQNITTIPFALFYDCENLKNVTFSSELTLISDFAFSDTGIEEIILPDTVTYIGEAAFQATQLKTFTVPANVNILYAYTFYNCRDLTEVHLSEALHTIQGSVFGENISLQKITVPIGNTYFDVEDYVLFTEGKVELLLYPSSKPETEYTVPNTVNQIGNGAFMNLQNLAILTLPDSVTATSEPNFLYSYNLRQFNLITTGNTPKIAVHDGVLYNADYTELLVYPASKPSTSYVTHPNTLTMRYRAFEGTKYLDIISFNEGLLEVTGNAFKDSSISEVNFSSTVQYIYQDAFYNADNLQSVTLPIGLIDIGNHLFYDCDNLQEINVHPSNPNFSSIDGVLFNKTFTELITYPAGKQDTVYSVPLGVDIIRQESINENDYLEVLDIPATVQTIEQHITNDCDKLMTVRIHTRITDPLIDINYFAFRGQDGITIYFYAEVYQAYHDQLNQTYLFLEALSVMPE